MRRRHAVAGASTLGAAVVALFGACADPTEITVRIATDLPCTSLSTSITGGRDTVVTTQCAPGSRAGIQDVGSIVLVPSGAKNDTLTITVVTAFGKDAAACDPKGDPACIVARRKLRYIRHGNLDLPIDMRAACLGKVCDADSTCELGVCVAANADNPALVAEEDAASTFDGSVVVDAAADAPTDATVDAAADAPIVDASRDADATPSIACKASTLVTGIAQTLADVGTLEVTATGIYWMEAGNIHYLPVGGPPVSLAALGTASRIAATSTTLYYAPKGALGVTKVALPFGSSAPVAINTTVPVEALHAVEGATDNPFYTDEVNVYANGKTLFPLAAQIGVVGSELVVTANDVWVTWGGSFYRGPRAGSAAVVPAKLTVAGATFHDLATNGTKVAWLSNSGSAFSYRTYEIATDTLADVATAATRAGLALRVYDDGVASDLVREPPGYPVGTGLAAIIDPGPVVGRITARDTCVYFWAKNAATGAYEIRAVPPL
jgi:hypothetical protein